MLSWMSCRFEVNGVHSMQRLKDVRVLLSILRRQQEKQLDVQTRIWPFSVQSLQERVMEFEIFTTDTRMSRVNLDTVCHTNFTRVVKNGGRSCEGGGVGMYSQSASWPSR